MNVNFNIVESEVKRQQNLLFKFKKQANDKQEIQSTTQKE